ncbi:hypothetical protein BOX15_Mlig001251g9, partial [Macrostomum lignano]
IMSTLVLGRIKDISFYDLQISLAEGKTGTVKVYNISNRYKSMLEDVVKDNQPKDMPVLTGMFSIGQYLPCLIAKSSDADASQSSGTGLAKNKLELSANPRDVNKCVPMHQLNSRMLLYGAIDSIEDHGFTIDLGVPGLVGFLPNSETTEYVARCNFGRQLCLGGLVPVRLLDSAPSNGASSLLASSPAMGLSLGETRIVRLTCHPAKLMSADRAWPETVPCSFDCLTPGAWLRARVHRVVDRANSKRTSGSGAGCLIAQFQGSMLCTVPKSHLIGKLSGYRQGDAILLTLVSIDQSTKTLIGSCLPHTLPPSVVAPTSDDTDDKDNVTDQVEQPKKKKQKKSSLELTPFSPSYYCIDRLSVGQTVKDAVVCKVNSIGQGATLWLPDAQMNCLIGPKHMPGADLNDQRQQDQGQVAKKKKKQGKALAAGLTVGDVVKVRIVDFSPMDNVAFGSLRPSVLELPFLRYEDVKLAAPITGTLLRYCKEGALVRVARNLRGLVPYLHLSDYPAKHQKHRHLEPDTELKCRVLSASAVDRKLILTAKPGLVRSEETPVTRLEQLLPGVLADCFVAKLDSNGILLAFYGAAKAWAPRTQLGLADSDSIEQVYYRGQVLRVRITRPAAGNRLPVASLLLEGKKSVPESQAAKNRSLLYKQLNKAGLGSLVSCRILAKQAGFFRVALITLSNEKDEFNWTNSIEARLPFEHLTDQAAYADALAKFRRIGDIVSPCVIWNLDASVVVSAKPSLVRFAKDGANFPKDFESIQVGDQLYGLAHQFKQYGWFVQLPAGFRGLAPVKALASEHPPFPLKDLFKAGQTVVAKVLEKNAEKQRCLLSLRVRDCARPVEDLDDSLLLLEETIKLLDSGGLCRNRALLPGSLVRVAVSATNAAETDLRFRKFRLLDSSSLEKSIAYKYTCTAAANQLLGADCTPGSRHKALVLSIDPNKRSVNLCLRPDLLNDLAAAQSTVRVADVQPGEAYPAEVLYAGFDYRMVALRLGPNTQQVAFLPARRHWNESYSASNPTVGSRIQVVVQRFVRGGSETDSRIYRLVALQSESAKSEGFRHLAPSAAKSGAALAKRKVTVGEAFAVRVMAITSCQLNVEDLHSRTKGRIFITEVTDSPQQMVSPLSNFSIGQELLARVVGIRSDRFHEDQSHPLGGKRSNLYELSARPSILNRPGNDFSDLFDLPPASVLPPMWLYVHHADPKLRKVSMYASIGRTVLVPYLDITSDIDQLAALSKSLPCGAALQAWRLPVETAASIGEMVSHDADADAEDHEDNSDDDDEESESFRVTCLGAKACEPLKAGDRVAAYVTSTSQFFYRACLPAGRSGQFHILDMDPSRPADIADLLSAAARRYGLPSRFSSRRAPFMLAEVIRVDRSANNCPVHWLRPVSAANANHQQSADTTNSSFLIGYVARHCDRGLAVTFGGLTRTAVVPVPPRARRLFPIGRRVRCSSSRDSGGGGGVNCSDNRHRPRLYRLEEPIPDAAEKPATTKPAATPTATAKTKSRRRRLSSSASVNDDAEDGARRTKTQRLDNGVVLVVHASNEKSSASKSGSYLPLDLADNESVDENEDVDVGESQNSSTASTKQNRRRSGSSSVANNKSEFESLVTREPSNASHWADYARYYVESGELDSARSIIERGLIAVGRLGAGDAADAGRKRLLRSLLLLESRAVAEAGEDPDAMDRLTQATYRACQMQDPGLIQLAVSSLLERGEANKAEAAAAKLRRARPDCPKAWRLQLEVKLRRGRNDDAKRLLFDQALSALPKRHHLGLLSGYAELACRYGRRADGVATFESLIESHPGRPELYLLYGRCLLLGGGGGGGIAAARELLAKAREILPDKSCSQLATLSDLIDNASSSMPTASVEGIPDGSAVVTGDEGLPLME